MPPAPSPGTTTTAGRCRPAAARPHLFTRPHYYTTDMYEGVQALGLRSNCKWRLVFLTTHYTLYSSSQAISRVEQVSSEPEPVLPLACFSCLNFGSAQWSASAPSLSEAATRASVARQLAASPYYAHCMTIPPGRVPNCAALPTITCIALGDRALEAVPVCHRRRDPSDSTRSSPAFQGSSLPSTVNTPAVISAGPSQGPPWPSTPLLRWPTSTGSLASWAPLLFSRSCIRQWLSSEASWQKTATPFTPTAVQGTPR
ncbi:hypothetical protein CPLU01_05816 [Colletotrichum plurivorum]|uniref:Uncharacterized protein n=1 Tax=Colletotrichum plurivorum TaxID=2175906 RepID=A0A8H6KKJ0_9PEZI|nr:hypothetical protein CPLU01_05816 [Colletotrichum plurivorum]